MGAAANGFTAKSEYDLGNDGIVDIHLEKGDVRIAVEIAVASRPQREIAHIKNCLAVGYDRGMTFLWMTKCGKKRKRR
jgi:hypothetical protein